MTNVYSSADVRDMDRAAIESGIPGLELMDAAARALYDTLCQALNGISGRRIVIFCGAGTGLHIAARALAATKTADEPPGRF